MQSVTYKAILVLACMLSTVIIRAAGSGAASHVQIAALAYPGSPVTVVPDRADSKQPPTEVRFTVTNDTDTIVRDYDVHVFASRPDGRPLGFRGTRQRAKLSHGQSRSAIISLPGEITLEPGSCLLIAVTAATFEDGSRWHAPEDAVERAKAEMLRVAATGALGPE